jgi:hypothetical protein
MVSGEELSSNSICLKMPIYSLEALELVNSHHEEFRCEYTILCLLFAEKPVTVTTQIANINMILWLPPYHRNS